MGWLGRLLGKEPPTVPASGRAFVCQDDDVGTWWTIRVAMPGEEPTWQRPCLQGSPAFRMLVNANAYLDWLFDPKGKPFSKPEGEA